MKSLDNSLADGLHIHETMNNRMRAILVLLPLCTGAPGCDVEPAHAPTTLRASTPFGGLAKGFGLSFQLHQVATERTLDLVASDCHPWQSYSVQSEETSAQCIDGEVVEITLLCEHHFGCDGGVWQSEYSECIDDGDYPRFEATGEPCGESA